MVAKENVAVVLQVLGQIDRGPHALADLALEGSVESGDRIWCVHGA